MFCKYCLLHINYKTTMKKRHFCIPSFHQVSQTQHCEWVHPWLVYHTEMAINKLKTSAHVYRSSSHTGARTARSQSYTHHPFHYVHQNQHSNYAMPSLPSGPSPFSKKTAFYHRFIKCLLNKIYFI